MLSSTPERRSTLVARNSDESNAGGDAARAIEREDSSQLNDSDEGGGSASHPAPKSAAAALAASCDIEDVDSESSADEDDAATAGELSIIMDDAAPVVGETGEVLTAQAASAHIKETEAGAEMSALGKCVTFAYRRAYVRARIG